MVCTCSAQSLPKNPRFVWEQPRVLKNADLMRTLCRLLQIYCRTAADLYKCVQLEHFFCHTPSMHNMNHADFVHTYADIMQTLNRHYADYHTRVHLEHFSVVISGKFLYCAMVFAGPTWHQRDGSVLVASRRFDGSRSRKTKGSLADTLQIRSSGGGLRRLTG